MKLHKAVVPAVEMFRLAEVCVSMQQDRSPVIALEYHNDTIDIRGRTFMTGAIAGLVHNLQLFLRIRQRDQEWMPVFLSLTAGSSTFVIDVHAFFAFACGLDGVSIHIDNGTPKEFLRLTSPNDASCVISRIIQYVDLGPGLESETEVACHGEAGNSRRVAQVEVRIIVSSRHHVSGLQIRGYSKFRRNNSTDVFLATTEFDTSGEVGLELKRGVLNQHSVRHSLRFSLKFTQYLNGEMSFAPLL